MTEWYLLGSWMKGKNIGVIAAADAVCKVGKLAYFGNKFGRISFSMFGSAYANDIFCKNVEFPP